MNPIDFQTIIVNIIQKEAIQKYYIMKNFQQYYRMKLMHDDKPLKGLRVINSLSIQHFMTLVILKNRL